MCLTTVKKRIKKKSYKVTEGYKVFEKDLINPKSSALFFEFFGVEGKQSSYLRKVPTGRWIKAVEDEIGYSPHIYTSGFHSFIEQEEAKQYALDEDENVVVKVKLKVVHTLGRQDGRNVQVSKFMYVPRQSRKKHGNQATSNGPL